MKRTLLILVMVTGAAGCGTIRAITTRSTEQMLGAAGFHMEAADTPEKLAELRTLPPRTITARARNGATSYVYSDPDAVHHFRQGCLYVGGESQYQEYQKLQLQGTQN